MNAELTSIIRNYESVLQGSPWYGKPVYTLLEEISEKEAFQKPSPGSHSAAEILYHMLTWATFTLKRLEKDQVMDSDVFDKLDWREIDPAQHSYEEGISALIATHQQIIAHLYTRNDIFLNEKVDFRQYDFRFLLNGLLQHNIYHAGQIALLRKWISEKFGI